MDVRRDVSLFATIRSYVDCQNPLPAADKTVVELPAPRVTEERPEPLVKKSA